MGRESSKRVVGARVRCIVTALVLTTGALVGLTAGPAAALTYDSVCPLAGVSSAIQFSGDGSPATSTQIAIPNSVAAAANGDVFIGDAQSFRVYKVDGNTGILTSVIGGNGNAQPGDGGLAIDAVVLPRALAFDEARNALYVSDGNAGVVRKVDMATGIITTIAGVFGQNADNNLSILGAPGDDGPATSAHFVFNTELAVHGNNLYVADTGDHRIRRIDLTTGIIHRFAGKDRLRNGASGNGGPAIDANIYTPTGLATDNGGNVYVTDETRTIRKIDMSTGTIDTYAGTGTLGYSSGVQAPLATNFGDLRGLAVDSGDVVYVADHTSGTISRITPGPAGAAGAIAGDGHAGSSGDGASGQAQSAHLSGPTALAVMGSSLYVADTGNTRVRRVDLSTQTITNFAGKGPDTVENYQGDAESGGVTVPAGVTSDPNSWNPGPLYYVDTLSNRVRRVDTGLATATTVAGTGKPSYPGTGYEGETGNAASASFDFTSSENFVGGNRPSLAQRGSTLYVSEALARIRAIDLVGGTVSTIAGDGLADTSGDGGPATDARFTAIEAIAVHQPSGTIFVADAGNAAVRSFTPGGTISKAVGNGVVGDGGDGGPATSANIQAATALAITDNALFIAAGTRIRKIALNSSGATGTISTVAGTATSGHTGDGGPAVNAELGEVNAMATDAAGDVFMTEYVNGIGASIRRIDGVTGVITTIASGNWNQVTPAAGQVGPTDANFGFPVGLAVSPDGALVTFTDRLTRQVRTVSAGGCGSLSAHRVANNPLSSVGSLAVSADQIPANLVPSASVDIGGTAIKRIDLAATGLQSSPLADIALADIAIKRIPLSSIPTTVGGGWAELLKDTSLVGVPLQNVTLEQVTALPTSELPADAPARTIRLRDVNISSSAIKRISLASLALGSTAIKRIPLNAGLASPADSSGDSARFAEWCGPSGLFPSLGFNCASNSIDAQSSMLAIDLAGVAIKRIPFASIPVRPLLLEDSAIKRIAIKRIDLSVSAIKRIAIKRIATSTSAIKRIPLVDLSTTSRDAIVDCTSFDCNASGATLEDAGNADAIRAGAELGDVAPSNAFSNYTLGDLAPAMDDTVSLADVLVGLVPRSALPWEEADLAALDLGANVGTGLPNTHQATFRVFAHRPAGPISLTAMLGGGMKFVPGSAHLNGPPLGVPVQFDAIQSGATVTFTSLTASAPPGTYTLTFDDTGGIQAGTFPVRVTIGPVVDGAVPTTVDSTAEIVSDAHEPANDAAPVFLTPNYLQLGHLGDGSSNPDLDLYTVPVPATPGTVTTITLSHLAADGDLAAFSSVPTPLLRDGGFRKIGLQSAPPETQDPDLRTSAPGSQSQDAQDVPRYQGRDPVAASAQRGTNTEEIQLVSRGEGGNYTLQVSAFNGATNPNPYLIFVRQQTPPGAGVCPARATPGAVANSLPGSLPAGTRTLFLVNQARLIAADPTMAGQVMTDLTTVSANTKVKGVVVPVDGSAAVSSAYANWDANGCNIDAANAVVNSINDVVDTLAPPNSAARSGLKSIVLVGGDDQIPMARVADGTRKSNESDYAGDVLTANASGVPATPNPLSAALANRNILTDDPYGTFAPIAWKDTALYVPDVALGRLVESPADIAHQLEAYVPASGRVDLSSSLVAGYDFLKDASQEIDAALGTASASRGAPLSRDTLTNDTWTKNDLLAKLAPPGPAPDVASVNAHFDHHQALPAAGNTTGDLSDLVTTQNIAAVPGKFAGKILFTLGCHSGFAFPDSYAGVSAGDRANDWAQTFGAQGALYVANTGFGYGDSAAVALSERLMKLYAQHLDGTASAGEALRLAKQDYFAGLAAFSDYDAKVMMESTFYGIPSYEVGAPVLPPAPLAARPVTPDPVTGLSSAVVDLTQSFNLVSAPGGTSYYTANGVDPQVTAGQPIQPRVEADVTQPSVVAHGAVLTALASTDSALNVAFAQPTVDQSANEPTTASTDAAFPSVLQTISTYNGTSGQRQRLNVMPGQWVSNGDPASPHAGVQRRFTAMTARVLYRPATDTDFTPPTTTSVDATGNGTGVSFDVVAGDAGGTVARVLVLYLDGITWHTIDLAPAGAGHWTGTGSATHTSVDFFVQAVDASGNVTVSSNKAHNFAAVATPAPPGNTTPSVSAGGAASITAGSVFSRTGSFTDPDATPWTATVNYGRSGDTAVPLALTGQTFTLNATYPNAGTFTAIITVCDAQSACGAASVNVTVTAPTATGPTVSIGDATLVEGDPGASPMLKFPVHLSQPTGSSVIVLYSTAAFSATSGTDYTAKTNATLKFGSNVVNVTISIPVKADTVAEADETMAVSLLPGPTGATLGRSSALGTIVDDDPGSGFGVAIGDATVVEGNSKNRTVTLVVTLRNKDLVGSHTVTYTTLAGTASGVAKATTVGGDYVTKTGTLQFLPKQFSKTIVITLKPDTTPEGDQYFTVKLTAGAGASVVRSVGRVTIADDD